MNRLLSILVTLFILFLVYLWINHLMGTSAREKTIEETPTTTTPAETYEKHTDEYTFTDDDVPDTTAQLTTESPAQEKTTKQDDIPEKRPEPKEEAPKSSPPPKPSEPAPVVPKAPVKVVDKDAGVHLVIAGNFLERANAEVRVKELKKLGYANAEVVNFELSEYHTACAGRYTDLNEARRVAKKIKDMHGIDTYVRHGN